MIVATSQIGTVPEKKVHAPALRPRGTAHPVRNGRALDSAPGRGSTAPLGERSIAMLDWSGRPEPERPPYQSLHEGDAFTPANG